MKLSICRWYEEYLFAPVYPICINVYFIFKTSILKAWWTIGIVIIQQSRMFILTLLLGWILNLSNISLVLNLFFCGYRQLFFHTTPYPTRMGQIQNCRHHIQEFGEEQEMIEITIKESMKLVDGDHMCSKQKKSIGTSLMVIINWRSRNILECMNQNLGKENWIKIWPQNKLWNISFIMKILLIFAILANWIQQIQSNFQENVKPLDKFHWFLIWKEPFGLHEEKDHSL